MIDDYHLQNLTTSSFINLSTGPGALHGKHCTGTGTHRSHFGETKVTTYLDLSVYHYRLKKELR
jgi:hypothetical protein